MGRAARSATPRARCCGASSSCGIHLIDTSWYYGPHVANRLIAETLHPYPKDLVLATKLGGARTPDKGWVAAISPEELREGLRGRSARAAARTLRIRAPALHRERRAVPRIARRDDRAARARQDPPHRAQQRDARAARTSDGTHADRRRAEPVQRRARRTRARAHSAHGGAGSGDHRRLVRSKRDGVPAVLSAGAAGRRTTRVDRARATSRRVTAHRKRRSPSRGCSRVRRRWCRFPAPVQSRISTRTGPHANSRCLPTRSQRSQTLAPNPAPGCAPDLPSACARRACSSRPRRRRS